MASLLLFKLLWFASLLLWNLPESTAADVPAIFVFGDSVADVGNNNNLNTTQDMKANFFHNGIDLPGKIATGRFSNGYNVIDWLAKFLGYEQSPPAFLSLSNDTQMLHGVNFASGGSGILDTTGSSTICFTTQIAYFKKVVESLVKQIGEDKTRDLLSKSLFLISTGSNDFFEYFLALEAQNSTQDEQFVATLIDKFGDYLTTLYKLGGRKFGVIGLSQIGCLPVMRAANTEGGCFEELNSLARSFNLATNVKLLQLRFRLPGMRYSYGDVYRMTSLAFNLPQASGFKEIHSACCGSGKFNGAGLCTSNANLCSNRKEYLFWDHFHPTEFSSMTTAKELYGGALWFASPINIEWLVKF